MQLSNFKALTFDCYGTLIDWESGMIAGLAPLIDRCRDTPSRDLVLQTHARHESTQQAQTPAMPYARLLATVYRRIAEEWGLAVGWDECVAYGNSVGDWPAFPDSVEALAYLKQHFKLVILSNVDAASFAGSNRRLGIGFDAVYTAEDIGSYKPDPRNFTYMLSRLETLGIGKADILHTAESMFHDHKPAKAFDLASAWIYRRHDKQGFGATMHPGDMPAYDFRFNSMTDMVEAHRREIG
ncbi:haloacid dehalogenase type II [Aureimonas glaciei]|uniref:Haloacid dehalogenase n=1 Tax=Aureimonas glaciei TaxID=1776957 RepID=A0A916XXS4_9HYPH|nr:haloacid dehalogenase type II [Aureimonas glaciei]GGD19371.1 haloacid dehalogenase [Aureimonas glaciei]